MMTRVRISLASPFSPSKFLLSLPNDVKTISNLKKHLLKSISAIPAHATSWKELKLDIEGFELLSGSEVDIIQESDVVTVSLCPSSSKVKPVAAVKVERRSLSAARDPVGNQANAGGRKRKRDTETKASKSKKARVSLPGNVGLPDPTNLARRALATHVPQVTPPVTSRSAIQPNGTGADTKRRRASRSSSTASSSSSSSSASSSSSSSSSSGSSTSSSSSPSSSSSSSASGEQQEPILKTIPKALFPTARNVQPMFHIPPGQGKPSTHDRNARRRKAKQYRKQAEQEQPQSAPIALGDESGEGHIAKDVTTVNTVDPSLVPSVTSNRNKKKGFLQEMRGMPGSRTVFASTPDKSTVSVANALPNGQDDRHVNDQSAVRDQELSAATTRTLVNGFAVQSPQIQTPGSRSSGKNRTIPPSEQSSLPSNVFVSSAQFPAFRKPQAVQFTVSPSIRADVSTAVETAEADAPTPVEEGSIALEPSSTARGDDRLMWIKVDVAFDVLDPVNAVSALSLAEGAHVAWKEVVLNQVTYQPELSLQIGRVTSRSDEVLTLSKLSKPVESVEGEFSEGQDGEAAAEEAPEDQEVVISLEELSSVEGKWRIVPAAMAGGI